MFEGLPAGLVPPVSLALAKAVETVPAAGALPGGCLYEMKWDGQFCLGGTGGASLLSRQNKDLSPASRISWRRPPSRSRRLSSP